jgi:hypothetical protein
MASTIPMAGTGSAPGLMAQSNGAPPTNPLNFLIAAADQSGGGDPHRSAPIPRGHALPAFTKSTGKHPAPPIKVVK